MSTLGLLFPGEMGALVGTEVRGDVLWASEGRSEATAARADRGGFRDAVTLAKLVDRSEIVLSVCPPAVAEEVARQVAAEGFRGLFVEANAIAPQRAERIAAMLAEHGARTVDGSVIGRETLHLYLSGERADVDRVTELFPGTEVTTITLGPRIGAASALKMAFGGWNKIGVALVAQAYAIARAYGVEEALAAEGVEVERFVRSARKAWRWASEMEEVAATSEALGLPGELGHGAADLFTRWERHRDRPADAETLLDDLAG